MLLLLSHDIMITPYLLRITPYHAICCALPSLTAECCAWLTHIHYMNTYMPSMPFISHTHRYMDKQSIRINTASLMLVKEHLSYFAPQSEITPKHYLAGISNSTVSSVLSHWVLPYFAVASAPFETCLLERAGKALNVREPAHWQR
jgi:REP element-mobilizing transposase RayT